MASIRLCSDFPYRDISVPSKFIDEYMPEANGEFVKIYLYLLRSLSSSSSDCSISKIADKFDHTEKDVVRALKYWERQKLLAIEYNPDKSIAGIHVTDIYHLDDDFSSNKPAVAAQESGNSSNTVEAATIVTESPASDSSTDSSSVVAGYASNITPIPAPAPTKKEYTLDDIKNFRRDPDVSELFFIIETYLKHTLSSSDINIILYWYEELHFPTDLIEYLVEYCISKGHSSTRYMNKVAISWSESGITTVEQAKENASIHSQVYYAVMKALGISGRNLVDTEMNYIKKWSKEFGFDTQLISLACQRTISAIHQPSFEYVDSIMTSWHNNQVHTTEDVDKLDAAYNKTKKVTVNTTDKPIGTKRNKFNNFNQREYDYDQLEKVLLTTSVQ
ncbi:MAG: DnaD domain protein [Agathobacter sp.]|nr:DnaD domain protein [Agathobacter sp.]